MFEWVITEHGVVEIFVDSNGGVWIGNKLIGGRS